MIKRVIILLLLITVIAVVVRLLYFPNNVYFGYDQARDAFVAQEMYRNWDFKLQGPSSSQAGVFHGPLLYYLIGPLYLLSSGDPTFVSLFFIALGVASIWLVYLLARNLTGKSAVGLIATLLYAVAYEQAQWGIFISNTSIAAFGMLLFFVGISYVWFRQKSWGWLLIALGFGIAAQSEVYLFYLLLPFLAWFWLYPIELSKIPRRIQIGSIVIYAISCLTYIVAEVKFRFPLINSLLGISGTTRQPNGAMGDLGSVIERLGLTSYWNVFGINPFLAGGLIVLFLGMLYKCRFQTQRKLVLFLFIWLISSLTLFLVNFSYSNIYHFSIGMGIIVILIASIWLHTFLYSRKVIFYTVLAIFVLSQLLIVVKQQRFGAAITLVQKQMLLSDEKQVVDAIAQYNEPVGVTAVTNPFNVNTVWAYAFDQYWPEGKPLPFWVTNYAKGFPGEGIMPEKLVDQPCTYFIIHEPADGVPAYMIEPFLAHHDAESTVSAIRRFGLITLEQRYRYNCMPVGERMQ